VRDGEVVHTVIPHRTAPVEEYLQRQVRYRHLFEPSRRDDVLRQLQADVDRYWAAVERA
jgi:pyruvate ferredoxin oxidoreductase beta subunit